MSWILFAHLLLSPMKDLVSPGSFNSFASNIYVLAFTAKKPCKINEGISLGEWGGGSVGISLSHML
jgi:hypothetical protein